MRKIFPKNLDPYESIKSLGILRKNPRLRKNWIMRKIFPENFNPHNSLNSHNNIMICQNSKTIHYHDGTVILVRVNESLMENNRNMFFPVFISYLLVKFL